MKPYQPKTGVPCTCKRGQQRDNCAACEGTGWQIDFAAIRARYPVHTALDAVRAAIQSAKDNAHRHH